MPNVIRATFFINLRRRIAIKKSKYSILKNSSKFIASPILFCKRLIKNVFFDYKHGGRFLGGYASSRYASMGAFDTANSDYDVLKIIFEKIKISDSDVLVDVGCGKGRVINYWLSQGLENKIYGIELDPEIADETTKRLKEYDNVFILKGDVTKNIPVDGTIFYLYNPFNAEVLKSFLSCVNDLVKNKSGVIIIYNNPRYIDTVKKYQDWKINYFDMRRNESLKNISKVSAAAHDFAIIQCLPHTMP